MKNTESAHHMMRCKYPRWVHLVLVAMTVLGFSIAIGQAAPTSNNGNKPVLTKSGKQAALKQAAQAIVQAAPAGPTDETAVPHYFGPFPNWANSPFTLPDATVTISSPSETTDCAATPAECATAMATVGAGGAVTDITITNPGSGYTVAPTVTIADTAGSNMSADATATITTSGSVTAVTVSDGGAGYTAPTVAFSGGGGLATPVNVGNPLITRTYATDYATSPGTLAQVLVVVPTTMPASGQVQSIEYFNQATTGSSPNTSAGNLFHAYVLQATGNTNEYTVAWDSGELTVPVTLDPSGEVISIPVPNIPVTTGDTIAFYGEGIPLDVGGGADTLSTPATVLPVTGTNITVGDATYPIYSQNRTYSFAATVLDTTAGPPLADATATAYGGVDAVELLTAGTAYTNPTVDFDQPDYFDGVKAVAHAVTTDNGDGTVTIDSILVDQAGSGYASAPNVVIRDGTIYEPIRDGGSGATATATLKIQTVVLDTFGAGYTSAPTVAINDPTATTLATATASINSGAVTAINLVAPGFGGTGYLTTGGIKKFQDGLPMLCNPSTGSCVPNNLGQYLPLAVPDTTTFTTANGFDADADYYVIALVQTREQMNSSLPATGTLLREYVQLETPDNASWSKHVELCNERLDGTGCDPIYYPGTTTQVLGVDDPHFLGPVIAATKDKPVRVVFYNLLPTGEGGDLFIPTDSTLMGAGPATDWTPTDDGTVLDGVRNPLCTQSPKSATDCYKDSRATLHLHGGISPWISDGTPHQWITPEEASNPWPEGLSVGNVPDMSTSEALALGVPDCSGVNDGCSTFYWTNQQSQRLMFYHDHAFGITRLNVYLGEAAGYLITDDTEKTLVTNGTIPDDQIPLVIQDRTFVPDAAQLAEQDPTWDYNRWGTYGDVWYHHVYMPAQNPGDPSGASAYGRWMYGPWFWPPASPPYGPIANPYYTGTCNLNDQTTWDNAGGDPACEPPLIPGTPNISTGMEQFNDTPIVNGTAYPTMTVEPKAYRLRILNAANDRFFNFSLYVADPTTGGTEVALNPAELASAQIDPNIFPTPDTSLSPPGPNWIVIGNEGGFLPAPAVVPPQPTTWIIDPTVFNVGNVDLHSLLVAPAERFDVVVDFSQYAGKTLILYNDAPAAFPARVSTYDYYTGAPDQYPVGAPATFPGYGPNTRTVMQIKVAATAPAPAFNLAALQNAFRHKADGSGVFEAGQHPTIVGQAEYNSAYGTSFLDGLNDNCNLVPIAITDAPDTTTTNCDGHLRINNQGGTWFGFNTLLTGTESKLNVPIEPKAIHDEMNAAAFDEFGRMTANMGLEVVPATPALQNIVLYPYINPPTEIIDATNLPKNVVGQEITPIASGDDGTQIWRITHNGVDTHPLHFHLYDVQLLNRVTWDNIVSSPDPTELGWKDTVRTSPLEDTIVALRPVIPQLPFELPNSIRPLNPALPMGSEMGFNNIDANGNPTTPIVNSLVNLGWEYVWHCHILSHEEMDMMRPQAVAVPPYLPSVTGVTKQGSTVSVNFDDNSITETAFQLQRTADGTSWTNVGTPLVSPLDLPNTHRTGLVLTDSGVSGNPGPTYGYRVAAVNAVGYGGEFPSISVQSVSNEPTYSGSGVAPAAPTGLTAAIATASRVNLSWTDNATNENGFVIQRSSDGGATFTQIGTAPARNNTGSVTFADLTVVLGSTYTYQVAAVNGVGLSAFATSAPIAVAVPAEPTGVTAADGTAGGQRTAGLSWTAATGATSYSVLWSNSSTMAPATQVNGVTSGQQINVGGQARLVYMQVRANNAVGSSAWTPPTAVTVQAQ